MPGESTQRICSEVRLPNPVQAILGGAKNLVGCVYIFLHVSATWLHQADQGAYINNNVCAIPACRWFPVLPRLSIPPSNPRLTPSI